MPPSVLLINAPATNHGSTVARSAYLPLSLLYLGTALKKNQIAVQLLDLNNAGLCPEPLPGQGEVVPELMMALLRKALDDFRPTIVGIGGLFSGAFQFQKMIASEVKSRMPDVSVVLGGIHATIFAKEVMAHCPQVDLVIQGEGEDSFLDLARCLSTKSSYEHIDGLAFRKNGSVIANPKKHFIDDLDRLGAPDFSLINVASYKLDTAGWYNPRNLATSTPFPILSSRSCPNRCTFCSMRLTHGPRIRYRSPDSVLAEMEHLYHRYNARYFEFMDDNLTYDKKNVLTICDGIKKRKLDIQFCTPNGVSVNSLDEEVIDAMVDAGLVRICLAIESGSELIRNRAIAKNLKTETVMEVVKNCAKHDSLFIIGFFVIGMPQETLVTLEETYAMIQALPLDSYSLFYATPYPGTALFKYCDQHGMLPHKASDYFEIGTLKNDINRPHFKPHDVTVQQLIDFRTRCLAIGKERRRLSNVPANYPLRYRPCERPRLNVTAEETL